METEELDYLPEDPKVPGVKYAIVSIIGPTMKAKCDVWGIRISDVADNEEKGKKKIKRLIQNDPRFDRYLAPIGKFFPLNVSPLQVENVEYQNTQLNDLMKSYLQSREEADDEFNFRKNDLMNQAIKETKSKMENDQLESEEYPVAVLKRKKDLEQKISVKTDELRDLQNLYEKTKVKYSNYTEYEKVEAEEILLKAIQENEEIQKNTNLTPEEIRKEILNDINGDDSSINIKQDLHKLKKQSENGEITQTFYMQQYKILVDKLLELNVKEIDIPYFYSEDEKEIIKIQDEMKQNELDFENKSKSLVEFKIQKENLIKKLQKYSESVNSFINKKWGNGSEYSQYFN